MKTILTNITPRLIQKINQEHLTFSPDILMKVFNDSLSIQDSTFHRKFPILMVDSDHGLVSRNLDTIMRVCPARYLINQSAKIILKNNS